MPSGPSGVLHTGNAWQQAAQNHQATAIVPGWGDAICFNELRHTTPYHNTWD